MASDKADETESPFDWDDSKAESNFRKHGVSFKEASTVLQNILTDEFPDEDHSITEERWIAIGHSNVGRLIVVSFMDTSNGVRIISARKATKQEIKEYESSEKIQRRRYDAP